jgi:hypothetical protein
MPTHPSILAPPKLAANDNGPGSRAVPAVILMSLADLLAEVCAARLTAANDNHPVSATKDLAE